MPSVFVARCCVRIIIMIIHRHFIGWFQIIGVLVSVVNSEFYANRNIQSHIILSDTSNQNGAYKCKSPTARLVACATNLNSLGANDVKCCFDLCSHVLQLVNECNGFY